MLPISRRTFLQSSLAVAGTAAFAGRSIAADDPFGGFTVGIQSYSFRNFKLEPALKKTKELGLKYAEFYRGHVATDSSPDMIASVKKLCAEYEVIPIAFGVESFTMDHEKNKKIFDFAQSLGVKYLSADPAPDSFDSLDKLVEKTKIAIAIHPHGPQGKTLHRWYSAEAIMKAVKDHHPLIGTCLDTGHLIRSAQLGEKLDPVQQVKLMGARNFGLHLKDHDNIKKVDVPYGDKTGVLDVLGVLKMLKEVNFKGYISIEYEANADNPSPDIAKCVSYFQEQVKKLG